MPKIVSPDRLSSALNEVLKEFDTMTQAKTNKGIRAAVVKTWGDIIMETPVDSGRARGNWFVTFDAPSNQKGSAIKNKGANYVATKTAGFDLMKKPKWFLTNNMPYITKLEYGGYPNPVKKGTWNKRKGAYEKRSNGGYSKLAPKGMVRRNLLKWRRNLRAAFRGLTR
jgi:hypothetical protein